MQTETLSSCFFILHIYYIYIYIYLLHSMLHSHKNLIERVESVP